MINLKLRPLNKENLNSEQKKTNKNLIDKFKNLSSEIRSERATLISYLKGLPTTALLDFY